MTRHWRGGGRGVNAVLLPLFLLRKGDRGTHHFPVARVHDGAVDVELVDDVGGLVPPAFRHSPLGVNLWG